MNSFLTSSRPIHLALLGAILAGGAGCADRATENTAAPPIVRELSSEVGRKGLASANPENALTTTEVKVTAVVDKEALLSQQFLYGADLQYSSMYDKGMDLYQQSMAVGHIPADFRIVGDELQLIADNRRLYPSEVNHPGQLITRFKILSQTDKTLTISGADSRVFLAQVFGATEGAAGLTDPKAKPARDLWVRSFDFAAQGNYLLQQTSVVLDDGTVAEFMESLFPRTTLSPGAKFRKIEMDPEDATGGEDALFERYRFLAAETIFAGEKKYAMAEHFDITPSEANPEGTIDWYVTPNVPEEALIAVKTAIEGWNRYFVKFKGVERDVVRFKGRLPQGTHLGDPRYNVINWDSRLIAGAAYETQAQDPATGRQSHSLIYLPAAWLQIGFNYWKNGQFSEGPASESVAPSLLAHATGAARLARIACLRDLRGAGALLASGRLEAAALQASQTGKDVVKEFGQRLLKTTLFHEVGHALGLAHNFKGSLSFDRKNPKSAFSTSIMDYNDYEIEVVAFSAVDSADGPALEYDRQALDQLYNQGTDVAASDPELPVCNDEEADETGLAGVDPTCLRYDIEHDPTLSIGTAWDRLQLAAKAGDVTLAQSLARIPGLVLSQDALDAVKTPQLLLALTSKVAASLKGSMQFYLTAGKASFARVARLNVKSLYKFAKDVLDDEEYNEREMRERAFAGVQQALSIKSLPAPVAAALAQAEKDSLAALAKTPVFQGLPEQESAKVLEKLAKALHQATSSIETDPAVGLPAVRAAVLASLARQPTPFFLGTLPGLEQPLNFETNVVGILADAVVNPSGVALERLTAAKALATYKGRLAGDPAIAKARQAIAESRAIATDNDSFELAQALYDILK